MSNKTQLTSPLSQPKFNCFTDEILGPPAQKTPVVGREESKSTPPLENKANVVAQDAIRPSTAPEASRLRSGGGHRSRNSKRRYKSDPPRVPNALNVFASNILSPTKTGAPVHISPGLSPSPFKKQASAHTSNGTPTQGQKQQSPHSPHTPKSPHSSNGSPAQQPQPATSPHASTLKALRQETRNGKFLNWANRCAKLAEFTLNDCITALQVLNEYPCEKAGDWLKNFWRQPNRDLISRIFARAGELLETASLDQITALLSTCANLQEFPNGLAQTKRELFATIADCAQSQLPTCSAKQLCTLTKSCEEANFDNPELLTTICREIAKYPSSSFTTQEFVDFYHAFAILGFLDPVLGTIRSELEKAQLKDDQLAPLIWSFAILMNLCEENRQLIPPRSFLFLKILLQNFDQKPTLHTPKNLSQACPALNYLQLFQNAHYQSCQCPELMKKMKEWEQSQASKSPKSSAIHREIQEWMVRNSGKLPHGYKFVAERFVGGYYIDITADKGFKEKYAIEVQGPSHFLLSGASPGNERLRHRILTQLGWNLAYISREKWKHELIAESSRIEYVTRALSPSPVPKSPHTPSSKSPSPSGQSTPRTPSGQSTPKTPSSADGHSPGRTPLPVYKAPSAPSPQSFSLDVADFSNLQDDETSVSDFDPELESEFDPRDFDFQDSKASKPASGPNNGTGSSENGKG